MINKMQLEEPRIRFVTFLSKMPNLNLIMKKPQTNTN